MFSHEEFKKINKDLFYNSMLKTELYTKLELIESGWLDTKYNINEHHIKEDIFTINFETALNDADENTCILINTGSYAPIHFGHFEMLLQAKKKLEENGFNVPVLLISPSHDNYVLTKSEDIKPFNIHERIKHIEYKKNLLKDDEKKLFFIDIWESLICEHPVNFTDVIFHIQNNLKKINKDFIKIAYVFGSDNQKFIFPFNHLNSEDQKKYFAICVERDQHPIKIKNISNNIFLTKNQDYFFEQSRNIRKQIHNFNEIAKPIKYNQDYGVRFDLDFAITHWIKKYPNKQQQLKNDYLIFNNSLKAILKKYLNANIIDINVSEQIKTLQKIINSSTYPIINIDNCTNALNLPQYGLNFSRLFNINDLQKNPISILNKNTIMLKSGVYDLLDDDISSGFTINSVAAYLKEYDITINKSTSLLSKTHENIFYDIIDTRDFLIGANEAGLTCIFNNQNCRIPYLFPFVNLFTRAKIPYEYHKNFTKDILMENLIFFQKNKYLLVNDACQSNFEFLKSFNKTTLFDVAHQLYFSL